MNEANHPGTMAGGSKCGQCGTPLETGALAGLCPACLLKQGAAADTATAVQLPPFQPPLVSELAPLFPQLEILELIGKGGMGAVYKARQPSLDRFVALKLLSARPDAGTTFTDRFNREARALARLNHPNIVGVYEFGTAGDYHFFLMEFVDGVNLRQLEKNRQLSPREALQIVAQICDALQYAHDEGIVHRDIKPENVLLDRRGRLKIADFGLAKLLDAPSADARLTAEGQVMGTPHYMAPEQVEHPRDVDHRADIYSLGVVFYELLTGELPLGKFPPPSRKVQMDVRLDDVVLRTLEKQPELRYQQAGEVKTAMETIAGTPASARAVPPVMAQTAPPSWWRYLKNRVWPPLVVRRNGQRSINRPALAMRLTRGVVASLFGSLSLAVTIANLRPYGIQAGFFPAWGICFAALLVLVGLVMTVRLLRGFAMPLDLIPELDPPTGTGTGTVILPRAAAPATGGEAQSLRNSGRLALGLFLTGTLGTLLLMTLSSRHELALIFGGLSLVLALVFGLMSWRDRLGKGIAIAILSLFGLGIAIVITSGVIYFLRSSSVRDNEHAALEAERRAVEQAQLAAARKDATREIVLRDILSGGEGFDLDSQESKIFLKEIREWNRQRLLAWLGSSGVDLAVIDYDDPASGWGLVAPPTLRRIDHALWENPQVDKLAAFLKTNDTRPELIEAENNGCALYRAFPQSEANTFAMQTSGGLWAVLQISGTTDDPHAMNPRTLKIRYKLVHTAIGGSSKGGTQATSRPDFIQAEAAMSALEVFGDKLEEALEHRDQTNSTQYAGQFVEQLQLLDRLVKQTEVEFPSNRLALTLKAHQALIKGDISLAATIFKAAMATSVGDDDYPERISALAEQQRRAKTKPRFLADEEAILHDAFSGGDVLDLDSRQLIKVTKPLGLTSHRLKTNGIELALVDYPATSKRGQLAIFPGFTPINQAFFDNPDVEKLAATLSHTSSGVDRDSGSLYLLQGRSGIGAAFAIPTSGGLLALVQITDVTENPRSVKIHYRLLQVETDRKVNELNSARTRTNLTESKPSFLSKPPPFNREAAELKLKLAELELKETESKWQVGRITKHERDQAQFTRDIAAAELQQDPVEVARLKLQLSELALQDAERKWKAGLATQADCERAKAVRDTHAAAYDRLRQQKKP